MLKNTFIHFRGFGLKKERSLWETGVLTWDDFEKKFLEQVSLFPSNPEREVSRMLAESRQALERGDSDYFAVLLPSNEHYRIALANPETTLFLDIETTGLSLYYDHTTIIGLADANRYYLYTKGGTLDSIAEVLAKAKCLVTFNGTMFDLKFLQKEFPQLRLPKAHVDLRFLGLRFGLRGSQKDIERRLGLNRPEAIRGVKGESAPLLWHRFIRGDADAGKRLVQYNHSDIEGMKFIFDFIFNRIAINHRNILTQQLGGRRFFQGVQSLRWASDPQNTLHNELYLAPFKGHVGTLLKYPELVTDERSRSLRVVGIDLTGSEKRPTGWCSLVGNEAFTKVINTDQQLIEQTVLAKPDIVSIDSPLSLPLGRPRLLFGADGRPKFGIMRECELTLKRRGVNVYPCLIDSMQKLTMRGIRLAKAFRKLGIPVIESYPGAAQDIMGIPRKRAGLEYLKEGLGEFGISGDFLRSKVTHDEVDAVTSAAVGLFFWAGKYEALGNDDEDYLIIPDLNADTTLWRQRVVVALSGPMSAGKTSGATFLQTAGFRYGRYSAVLAKILESKGITKISRKELQKFGEEVHRKRGQRWLARQLVRDLISVPEKNLAIDGLRFPEDHAFLVECFGPAVLHIHVDASTDIRRARYVKDGKYSVRDFEKASQHIVEASVPQLADLAHARVINEGSEQAFHDQLKALFDDRILASELKDQVDN